MVFHVNLNVLRYFITYSILIWFWKFWVTMTSLLQDNTPSIPLWNSTHFLRGNAQLENKTKYKWIVDRRNK